MMSKENVIEPACECSIEEAKKYHYCFTAEKLNDCQHYVPLEGEGKTEIIKRTKVRRGCQLCENPADYRVTFLLPNSRSNPASKGYRGDDISRCSDDELFSCEEHKLDVWNYYKKHRNWGSLPEYEFCACFPLKKFPHMGLIWKEEKIETLINDKTNIDGVK